MSRSFEPGTAIPLVVTLVKPDGTRSQKTLEWRNSVYGCVGCDPYPGAPPDVCKDSCSYRRVSTQIELSVLDLVKAGIYHVEVTGPQVGTAAVDLHVLDSQRWEAYRERRYERTVAALEAKGATRPATIVRACADVKRRPHSIVFMSLPPANIAAISAPRTSSMPRLGPGGTLVYVFRRDNTYTLVARAFGRPVVALSNPHRGG